MAPGVYVFNVLKVGPCNIDVSTAHWISSERFTRNGHLELDRLLFTTQSNR